MKSLFKLIFPKKNDFVEILSTLNEEEIQLCINYLKENKGKIKSIVPYFESHLIEDKVYDYSEKWEPKVLSVNYMLEASGKTLFYYSASEKINVRKFLDDKNKRLVEKYRLENLAKQKKEELMSLEREGFKESFNPFIYN